MNTTASRPRRCHQHTNRHRAGCPDCRRYAREYRDHRNRHIDAGTWDPGRVDVEPVRAHVRALLGAGMYLTDIAAAARMAPGQVNRITYATDIRRCSTANAQAILAVQAKASAPRYVDGTGTRRRIRALVAAGWTQHVIADRLGLTHGRVSTFATLPDGAKVARSTRTAVAAVYGLLHLDEGPSDRVRLWAQRRNWAPPEAWSDATIGDPAAQPYDWCRDDVDEVALTQVEQGTRRFRALTEAERVELARRHCGRTSQKSMVHMWRVDRRTLLRYAAKVDQGAAVAA